MLIEFLQHSQLYARKTSRTVLFHKQWATGIETFTKVSNAKEGIIGIITICCLPKTFSLFLLLNIYLSIIIDHAVI